MKTNPRLYLQNAYREHKNLHLNIGTGYWGRLCNAVVELNITEEAQ